MIPKCGLVVVLNGASSAGKTFTAQALLALCDATWVSTGFDELLERIQPFGAEKAGVAGSLRRMIRAMHFQWTDGRLQLFKMLHREVVSHAQEGRNVIVETALMELRALKDAAECFAPINGYFIGLKPPLTVSEEWEALRGDRPVGQARKHYDIIHAHGIYDLLLDPSVMTPQECAEGILTHIKESPPIAFYRLLSADLNL